MRRCAHVTYNISVRALTYPTFRRLFGAQVASLLGTGLLTVALGLLA